MRQGVHQEVGELGARGGSEGHGSGDQKLLGVCGMLSLPEPFGSKVPQLEAWAPKLLNKPRNCADADCEQFLPLLLQVLHSIHSIHSIPRLRK